MAESNFSLKGTPISVKTPIKLRDMFATAMNLICQRLNPGFLPTERTRQHEDPLGSSVSGKSSGQPQQQH